MNKNNSSLDKLKKWNNRLEKVWLIIAIVTLIISVIIGFVDNWEWDKVANYFLLSGLAWGIYLIRRGLRIRLDKNAQSSNN
tara:strand:- start:77 stop:319 length:243 start_codon:yes stop_codon:yes gene_type:complete